MKNKEMGIEQSRLCELPEDIDERFNEFKELWKSKTYHSGPSNILHPDKPFLSIDILSRAGNLLALYMNTNNIIEIKVLEIMAGNGMASKYMKDGLIKGLNEGSEYFWKSTELQNVPELEVEDEEGYFTKINYDIDSYIKFELDSHEAVVKYGTIFDTLLMISPPPGNGYGDYFAIKEWTKMSNSKYIVIVGELGASDGSEGMYKYMMENPIWKCKYNPMLSQGIDILGGPVEKQLFIFAKD
jgi:hypothetical protein